MQRKKVLMPFSPHIAAFSMPLPSHTQQNAAPRRVLLTRAGAHIAACGSYMRRAACRPTARAVRSLHFVPNAALQFYVIRQRN